MSLLFDTYKKHRHNSGTRLHNARQRKDLLQRIYISKFAGQILWILKPFKNHVFLENKAIYYSVCNTASFLHVSLYLLKEQPLDNMLIL